LIVVPSTLLQTQWNQEVEKIIPECNGEILNVGGNYQKWKKDLPSFSKPTKSNKPKIIIAVVNTAAKNDFRSKLNQGDHLMLIADEVHRLGSDNFSKVFDIKSGPRLGLSATPERYNDPLGTDRIFDYFGNSLEPPYELKDAIGDSLVGYEYYPTECQLTQSELDEWDEMSEEIRKLAAKCPRNKKNEIIPSKALQLAQIFRSKIAKTAENKVELTSKILRENFKQGQQWLVYCDSQHQIHSIQQELLNHGLMPSIYHSELKEIVKRATLDDFKNDGGILLSIRCLDEGVDIPSLSHALVIASSQNPRQFIQRRGRVLRKDRDNPEKRKAYIYDLVVYADSNALDSVKSLALTELRRALEFGNNADNKEICSKKIRDIARKSGIDLNEDEDALQMLAYEEEDD
jgi:superfamily II DNA or RNA helicase